MFENYRKYQRYSICASALISRRGEGPSERFSAQVNTISQGGMGFYADMPLEKATPVTVELSAGTDGTVVILEGEIASICSLEKDFFVGVSFIREISYERFVEIIG